MLKIWGRINSTNVKKALWAAEELGLAYEQIDVGGQFESGGAKLVHGSGGIIPLRRSKTRPPIFLLQRVQEGSGDFYRGLISEGASGCFGRHDETTGSEAF